MPVKLRISFHSFQADLVIKMSEGKEEEETAKVEEEAPSNKVEVKVEEDDQKEEVEKKDDDDDEDDLDANPATLVARGTRKGSRFAADGTPLCLKSFLDSGSPGIL
jgi:hypothetical protein